MLVLLPPSESKAAPARRGRGLDLDGLSFPELTDLRKRVLEALGETSGRPDALSLLGVGPSLAQEVARNLTLRTAPTRPAHAVYTGVLYDALGWPTLSPAARRRGGSRIVIISALWGALRPNDRVPSYRLSMDGELPGLGPLARLWRPELTPVLTAAAGRRGLVVDCRSGPYTAAGPLTGTSPTRTLPTRTSPTGTSPTRTSPTRTSPNRATDPGPAVAGRTVAIRVLREQHGRRSVVSHLAKHTRGQVTRHLLEQEADPATPAALAEVVGLRWPVELVAPARPGAGWALDVILHED